MYYIKVKIVSPVMLNHSENWHNCMYLLLILVEIHYLLGWGGICTCRTWGYSNTPWSNNNKNYNKQTNLVFSKNLLLNKFAWHYGWKLTSIGSDCNRALPLIASCLYMIYSLQPGIYYNNMLSSKGLWILTPQRTQDKCNKPMAQSRTENRYSLLQTPS